VNGKLGKKAFGSPGKQRWGGERKEERRLLHTRNLNRASGRCFEEVYFGGRGRGPKKGAISRHEKKIKDGMNGCDHFSGKKLTQKPGGRGGKI